MKLSGILLFTAAGLFLTGLILCFGGLFEPVLWAITLPLGAVVFGLFLITRIFEKEMAGFDEDEARRFTAVRQERTAASVTKPGVHLEEAQHGTVYAHH